MNWTAVETQPDPMLRHAPEGTIWVCHACGKTSSDKYGMEGEHSRGWDESCMLNSVLCQKQQEKQA